MLDDVARHVRAQRDFLYFCQKVLGYEPNDVYTDYRPLSKKHYELCSFLQGGWNFKLILNPRYTIKSGIANIGYCLWRIVKDPNIRILIYSGNCTKARGFLVDIKNHIMGKAPNSKFRDMYPGWESDPRQEKWTEEKIIISKRTASLREPTVDTAGIETSKVGVHVDLLILDDIVDDINSTTKIQMDKVYECYRKSLSLLKPGGDVVIIGTPWSYGDTYARIQDENQAKGNLFKVFRTDAEERDENGRLIYEDVGLNEEFLDRQKKEQGSYLFSCLYRCNPANADTAIFRMENFRFYDYIPGLEKNLYITGTCDPAGEGEDFTAITVMGTDFKKNMYVLDAVNRHLKPNEIVNEIIRLNYKWKFDRFAVEKNFFKGMLEKEFREAEKEHLHNKEYKQFGFSEEIVTSVAQRNWTRVLALQPIHERGQLYFPGKGLNLCAKPFSDLIDQMLQFTVDGAKSAHDDLLMSLAYQLQIALPGGEAETEYIPKNSPAWLEKKWIEEHNKLQSRIPRGRRRYFEPSLS